MSEISQKLNPNKINKLTSNVYSFLEKYRIPQEAKHDVKFTHIAMGDTFMGKFQIDKKEIEEFNRIYSEAIQYGIIFNIAEKPRDYGPILIDIDLEVAVEDYIKETRLYNNNIIIAVIDAFKEGIKKYLDIDDDNLQSCLIEKPIPTEKINTIKDGFHIIFTGVCAHYKLRHLIRIYAITILEETNLFDHFTKPLNDIVDKAVVSSNSWLMYGSKKKDGHLYQLTRCINEKNEDLNTDKYLNDKYLCVKMLSLQQKHWAEKNAQPYLEEFNDEIIEEEYTKKCKRNYTKDHLDYQTPHNKEDEVRRATILVSLLNDDRAHDFTSWIRVGWALHNIDYSLLQVWTEFSRK